MNEATAKAMHETDDEAALLGVWKAFGSRLTWQRAMEHGSNPDVAGRALAELPEVNALDALEANRQLIELLTIRRWWAMEAAREAGASWSEIGAALGMSKQGAQDWYRRKVAEQAAVMGGPHDGGRTEAAAAD